MTPLIVANWKTNPSSLEEAKEILSGITGSAIICPPLPFLYLVNDPFIRGAQDVSVSSGTGEVSAQMLKSMGVEYVIIGHSERKESRELVDKKISACLSVGLTPIVCITEVGSYPPDVILAFEPISAIGTGSPYPPEEARKIREAISGPLLYGGSVTSKNAYQYTEVGFDGFLIGGASLNPQELSLIINYEY